ncbi:MAG: hypothetical protein AAF660_01425 [Pseudomonadota bacterium]
MSWHEQKTLQLAACMSDLTGRKVSAHTADGKISLNEGPGYIATYTDQAADIVGLCRCDIAGAASLGAALSLVSPARVEDSVRDGSLDERLLENFAEVCNVMSRLFSDATTPVVRLGRIHPTPLAANDSGVDPEQDGIARLDLSIGVTGYTQGQLTLIKL